MIKMPGPEYYPIAFANENIVIRRAYEAIHVWKNSNYKTPLKGIEKRGWLSCGIWKIKDGKYYEVDGIGLTTGIVLNNIEAIIKYYKGEE